MAATADAATWLRGHLGEPAAGVAGDSPEARADPERMVRAVAGFLASIHRPCGSGPDVSSDALLDRAAQRCRDGMVDASRIDEAYRSRSPEQLLESAYLLRPTPATASVVLGARDLGAFDLRDEGVVGWRPGSYCGCGDPAMDVTWVASDIAATLGPAFVVVFAETYGEASPGPQRSEFWMTLGQLL